MSNDDNQNVDAFNIFMLNCNSINSKLGEIKELLYNSEPDIFCFTETWLTNLRQPNFHNYTAEWQHRDGHGGGLGILIKQSIQYTILNLQNFPNGVLEVQGITVYMNNFNKIDILNIYDPAGSVNIDELKHYASQLNDRCIITGDFNAHSPILMKSTTNSNLSGRALEELLLQKNLCLINPIDLFTYTDRRSGKQSCLDLCLTSSDLAPITNIDQLIDVGSDHLVMQILCDISPSRTTSYRKAIWKIDSKSLNNFKNNYIASKIIRPNSLSNILNDVLERITESANSEFGPKITRNGNLKKKTPWWNKECQQAVQIRRKARKQLEKHPTNSNLGDYKLQQARAKYTLKKNKRTSFRDYISSLNEDVPQSQIWRKLKSFKSSYVPQNYPIKVNDTPILNNNDKADLFCKHFQQDLQDSNDRYINNIEDAKKLDEEFNVVITRGEIEENLRNLKNKSPGPDGISNELIKSLHSAYLDDLLDIFNQCLHTSCYPNDWKYGHIIPIHKPGKPADKCSSYRPIVLLSCLGKLFERIINKRLEFFIESKNKLNSSQFGFRPKKGTADVLTQLGENIEDTFMKQQFCAVVYIDLEGAFDRVWRHGLLYKLTKIGICGRTLALIEDYLTERYMSVQIQGTNSSKLLFKTGVPQGAVLSPALFNVMLHDIPQAESIKTYLFADDITIVCQHKNFDTLQRILQTFLNTFMAWAEHWHFIVNSDKTKMQIFSKRRFYIPKLRINNREIEYRKQKKLLGLIFDCPRLTWKPHMV